jgi:uncharacterized protein (DUF885 family)
MIDRRQLLAAAAALPASRAFAQTPPASGLDRFYSDLFEALLRASPTTATTLGFDKGPRAAYRWKLDDKSPAGRMGVFKPLAEALPRLKAFDRSLMAGTELSQYDTVIWSAERAAEASVFPYGGVDGYNYPCPYVLSQLSGDYQNVPDFLDTSHQVETREDAEAYLSRLQAFAANLVFETERTRADAGKGVIAPDFILDKTIAQLKALAAQKGEASGLASSLDRRARAKNLGEDWGKRAARIVDGPVAAGLAAQISLLTDLRAKAAHDAGIGRLPQADAFYAMALRFHTTTRLTPDEAHAMGLDQVAALSAQVDPLLRARGLTDGSVGARLAAFGKQPDQLYPNTDAGRAAILADLQGMMAAALAASPSMFNVLPKAGMLIRRVPEAIELGAPRGYAESGTADGVRPGTFYINLKDTTEWPRWTLPTLTYHESVPGHLFQGAVLLEHAKSPDLFKLLDFTAYGEGWGLYAEQLGNEMGLYDAYPEGRIGFIQSLLYRAARIVLDTGIHAKGWSREKAIAYMVETVGLPLGAAENEIDRYCVWPGQACGYKIGHTEIDRLRTKARAGLGPKFDLKGFNDTVLLAGPMPLAVLERVVDDWTVSKR